MCEILNASKWCVLWLLQRMEKSYLNFEIKNTWKLQKKRQIFNSKTRFRVYFMNKLFCRLCLIHIWKKTQCKVTACESNLPFQTTPQKQYCNCLLFDLDPMLLLLFFMCTYSSLCLISPHRDEQQQQKKCSGLNKREWEWKRTLVIVICCWGLAETFYRIVIISWLVEENNIEEYDMCVYMMRRWNMDSLLRKIADSSISNPSSVIFIIFFIIFNFKWIKNDLYKRKI